MWKYNKIFTQELHFFFPAVYHKFVLVKECPKPKSLTVLKRQAQTKFLTGRQMPVHLPSYPTN